MQTNEELDRLFIEFVQNRKSDTPRSLAAWIADNPDITEDLVAWAADSPVLDYAEKQPGDPAAEARTIQIGMGVLTKLGFVIEQPLPFATLNDGARQQGIVPKQLAQKLGIGFSLFAKLNRRLLNLSTIPNRLVENLATELRISVDQVRAYLSQPPTLAAGALYRADEMPRVTQQQDFAEAVRACSDMSEVEKAEWIG